MSPSSPFSLLSTPPPSILNLHHQSVLPAHCFFFLLLPFFLSSSLILPTSIYPFLFSSRSFFISPFFIIQFHHPHNLSPSSCSIRAPPSASASSFSSDSSPRMVVNSVAIIPLLFYRPVTVQSSAGKLSRIMCASNDILHIHTRSHPSTKTHTYTHPPTHTYTTHTRTRANAHTIRPCMRIYVYKYVLINFVRSCVLSWILDGALVSVLDCQLRGQEFKSRFGPESVF